MTTNPVDRLGDDLIEKIMQDMEKSGISKPLTAAWKFEVLKQKYPDRASAYEEAKNLCLAVPSANAASQSNHSQQIKDLVEASAATLAAVTRLEGIVEGMIYREGRGNEPE